MVNAAYPLARVILAHRMASYPMKAAKTEVCTGQACSLNCLRGRGCCQPQRDREGGAEVLKVHH